jgi:hypothetical protein
VTRDGPKDATNGLQVCMIHSLLSHNWKRIKRSPDLQRNIGSNALLGLMLLIFFINVLSIGLMLDRILKSAAPDQNPLTVLNGLLLYYYAADLLMRFFFQKVHTLSAKPYLILPVKRVALVHTLLLKSLLSWFNFAPLLVIVPALFSVVGREASGMATAVWFLSLFALTLTNSYLNNYLRHRLTTNPMYTGLIVLALVGLLVGENYQLVSLAAASSALFQLVLDNPPLVLVPFLLLALAYRMNFAFLFHHLFLDEVARLRPRRSVRDVFAFAQRFGPLGRLIGLEAKLLIRNKRPRTILIFSFAAVFYGFLVYPTPIFATMDYLLILVGMIVFGIFAYSYAVFAFGWESSYFDSIITRGIDIRTYLRAKYILMAVVTTVAYLLSLFYGVYGMRIVLVNTMVFLYTVGVGTIVMLYLATFNKVRLDIGTTIFSQQGRTGFHYAAFFVAFAVHLAVFVPVKLVFSSDEAFVALGAVGLTGILLHRRLIDLLGRQFLKRKHVMVAGFRST